jgi:ATP-binding cassette subfamily B protein
MWGNLSRLSGNITAVLRLITLPRERERSPIEEPLARVEVADAGYAYDGRSSVGRVSFVAEKGRPVLIQGPSGSGKTTIANLAAGIYRPASGRVVYVGASGRRYDSERFRARVGYVAQDVYMFRGTIRDNLVPEELPVSDDRVWACLAEIGAAEFVRALGGLDAPIAEAGRSLSGGERRRLAIARSMLTDPDFLIFDEITAGLDESNRLLVRDAVMRVSGRAITIIVTHEELFSEIDSLLVLR